MNANLPMAPRDYHDAIDRVSTLKDVDVDKLQKLMEMQEQWEKRQAAAFYNEQMGKVQNEIEAIEKNQPNPATRSRYADLAAVLAVVQPIYSRHGFSVEFNEEPDKERPNDLHLVAYVSCGSETRRREIWVPIGGQGLRGGASMTPTHAKIAAVTYGRRALIKMIFNLSEEDDDGNRAGGRAMPERPSWASGRDYNAEAQRVEQERYTEQATARPQMPPPPHDPATGEILGPHRMDRDGHNWQEWGATFLAGAREAKTPEEIDRWVELNADAFKEFKSEASAMYGKFEAAVNRYKLALQVKKEKEA